MAMKRIKKKKLQAIVIASLLLSTFYFGPSLFGGYYWTESAAAERSLGNWDLEEVYEKEFGDKKVIVQDNGFERVAKVIERPLGLFYQAELFSRLSAETADGKIKFGWVASQKKGKYYEVLLATETMDENIKKIIVTNEFPEKTNATLDELKELSDLFIEMEVENGHAAYYLELPNTEAGGFQFRGINKEGEIISIS